MKEKEITGSFENNLTRLEEISLLLEQDDIGLEKAITLYEEGIELSQICITALKNAELKVTQLKKKLDEVSSGNNLFSEE
jgi:exodeoxyribonuclease VII small subunit